MRVDPNGPFLPRQCFRCCGPQNSAIAWETMPQRQNTHRTAQQTNPGTTTFAFLSRNVSARTVHLVSAGHFAFDPRQHAETT